ncbi:MAG: guanylate kinase [Candidatus Porifericomitaceae bacterium WSBS_2022_MAG_OTU9]
MTATTASLFIISGASGTGKTSLVRGLLQSEPGVGLSVSHTTRPPRQGEIDGRDYHFVSNQQFSQMQKNDEFLEHADIYGHHYGTCRKNVNESLDSGKDVLLEIDWQGAKQVCANFPAAVTIFVLPPDLDTLRRRLEDRGRDGAEVIARRMQNAMREITQATDYRYLVVNSQFTDALADLRAIISSYRGGAKPDGCRNQEHLRQLLASR